MVRLRLDRFVLLSARLFGWCSGCGPCRPGLGLVVGGSVLGWLAYFCVGAFTELDVSVVSWMRIALARVGLPSPVSRCRLLCLC